MVFQGVSPGTQVNKATVPQHDPSMIAGTLSEWAEIIPCDVKAPVVMSSLTVNLNVLSLHCVSIRKKSFVVQ